MCKYVIGTRLALAKSFLFIAQLRVHACALSVSNDVAETLLVVESNMIRLQLLQFPRSPFFGI